MKKLVVMMMVLGSGTAAHADGFVCQTTNGSLNVKVYNHRNPEAGTRNAAVMVLSNPELRDGNKTIARFTDVKDTLASTGAHYVADVDLRFSDTGPAGKYIGGTRLGEVDTIALDVDFNYSSPISRGDEVMGTLTLNKRNGQAIELDVECSRYLAE